MHNILSRYIAKSILQATALSAIMISGLLILLALLGELKNIGEGDYDFLQGVLYVLLRLPSELYQFSPMLILLGSIIGLSVLSTSRELAIMRTSGYSLRKIIFSVFSAAIILTLIVVSIGEGIAPNLSYQAEVKKENAKNAGQAVVTANGVWLHLDNNFIHVEHVVGRRLYERVTRYEYDLQHRLQAAYFAQTLSFQNNKWEMHDVMKTTFFPEQTKSHFYAKADWNLKFNPNLLTVGLVEPSEMSLSKLARFSHYLKQNGLQAREYQYEFWQRIFQPLASLVMIFLAIPFVLGTLNTTTTGWRIVLGIITGFIFFILNSFLGQLCIVYQLPAFIAALFPIILFSMSAALLAKRFLVH